MFDEIATTGSVFDESHVAGITYFAGTDGKVQLDIELFDYSNESMDALGHILTTLSMDSSYISTLNMIRDQLEEEGQADALLRVYNHIAKSPSDKAVRVYTKKTQSKPCIRPSDML